MGLQVVEHYKRCHGYSSSHASPHTGYVMVNLYPAKTEQAAVEVILPETSDLL